jgi:hypothetical protein
LHVEKSHPGWTHQDSVRTQNGRVHTHWKGQTLTHIEMPPVGVPSSPLLFAWHAEGSQPGGTRQGSVRTQKGVNTHWKGQTQHNAGDEV